MNFSINSFDKFSLAQVPIELRRFSIAFYILLQKLLAVKPQNRGTIEDIFGSEFCRTAVHMLSETEGANLDKELSLCGASANKTRRMVMLSEVADRLRLSQDPSQQSRGGDPYLSAHHKTTIKSLRDSVFFTCPHTGAKKTRHIEAPHGFEPHDYHEVDAFLPTESSTDHPKVKIPQEPE